MSQYSSGTASVTNGSPTVTGSGTLWSANVSAADSFTIAGDGVMYDVASVDSDTSLTLSVSYAGSTASGAVYAIGTGFTVPDSFPEMSQGDIETATIFTRAMRGIQGKFSSILAGGASANFTAMPQVGGDPIVESGSNSNGEYTKFADGTMICLITQIRVCNGLGSGSLTDMYRSFPYDWTFPVSFVGTPVLSSSVKINSPGPNGFVVSNLGQMITSTSVTNVQMFRGTNVSDTETCHLQAIGRWF